MFLLGIPFFDGFKCYRKKEGFPPLSSYFFRQKQNGTKTLNKEVHCNCSSCDDLI